jgi:hypothetical protein
MAAPTFQGLGITIMASSDDPLATYTIRNSSLDKLSDLLIQGDRKKAYQYALDEKLWAHAMVIASSVDKEAWKEVVTEFVRTELGASGANKGSGASSNGREPLRVAYNVFAGQGASACKHLCTFVLDENTDSLYSARDDPSRCPTQDQLRCSTARCSGST